MSFPKQAALAALVVVVCVGGLVFLGRQGESVPASDSDSGSVVPQLTPPADKKAPDTSAGVSAHPVRNLVPPQAWLVADFQGDLTGQKPFADQPGMCAEVPAPERVAMAVLPPAEGNDPDLLIAAEKVEDVFWGCARDRIVRAGGTALAQNDRYEVLRSPSGVVARGPLGSMVFLTSEGHLESALSVLSDLTPGAGAQGPHAKLLQRIYAAGGKPENSLLDITLSLPDTWLDAVGQDKEKTPLRFVHSAFVSAHADGSAQGGIDCDEDGCAQVLDLIKRGQADMLEQMPPDISQAINAALTTKHLKGSGRIAIDWSPTEVPLAALLGRFFGPGAFGP